MLPLGAIRGWCYCWYPVAISKIKKQSSLAYIPKGASPSKKSPASFLLWRDSVIDGLNYVVNKS